MTELKRKILIIDDETSILETFSIFFESININTDCAATFKEGLIKIDENYYDVIITDYRLDDKTGLDVLNYVKNKNLLTPVILMTAYSTIDTATKAIKLGIYDYLIKPINFDVLSTIVDRAIEKHELQKEIKSLKKESDIPYIIGKSPQIKVITDMINRVASTDVNVLVSGESGTGKELVAKAIHELSLRKLNPFLPLNCGAIPENLIESELFGYTKGSFTGANTDKDGVFIAAKRGTVFLDEIGELPIQMQPRLLRVLQEQKVKRIGEQFETPINVRIIAATNKNLKDEVEHKKFREDLYYRLNVINIVVPPLRERKTDIPLLLEFFIEKFNKKLNKQINGCTNEVIDYFYNYAFPGNVRELENIIERMMIFESNNILTTTYLPLEVKKQTKSIILNNNEIGIDFTFEENMKVDLEEILDKVERYYLLKALNYSNGVKKDAAELLNLSFRSIRYRLEKHKIE